MIYLASPLTHPDLAIREERHAAVCRHAARMIREGQHVFSPIAHSYTMSRHGLSSDWRTWRAFDLDMLARCDELVVLMLPGWQDSVGVKAEIEEADRLDLPVSFVEAGE